MIKKSASSCIDSYEKMINWVAQNKEFSIVNRHIWCFSSTLHSPRRLRMVDIWYSLANARHVSRRAQH